MSLVLIPVKVTARRANGNAVQGATVRAVLTVSESDDGLVVPGSVTGTTNSSGEVTLNLWPNSRGINGSQYRIEITAADLYFSGLVTIPEAPNTSWPISLETLINQPPYPARSVAELAQAKSQEYMLQAKGYRDEMAPQVPQVLAARDEAVPAAASATAAKVAAEAARDAVNTTGKVFTTTALGIAGTSDGQSFSVLSADLTAWDVYKNNAGVAVFLARSYTTAYLDALAKTGDFDENNLFAWLDSASRLLARIEKDGSFIAKLGVSVGIANGLTLTRGTNGRYTLSLGTAEGKLPVGNSFLQTDDFSEEVIAQLLDTAGRRLWYVGRDGYFNAKLRDTPEVVAARGSTVDLSARLTPMIRADGLPTGPVYGEWNLRETRRALVGIRAGDAGSQFAVAQLGDSWTDSQQNGLQSLARCMKGLYGDAGSGYIGVERGSADPVESTQSRTGGWVLTNFTVPSPHIRKIESSTVGDRWTVNIPEGANTLKLIYLGGAGTVQYRYNSGSWSSLTLDGTGTQAKALTPPPGGAITVDVEITSGTVALYGLDSRKTANGVRIDKLGASSTALTQWAALDAAQWQQGITALAPDLAVIMFGTNDAHQYTASTFAGHLQTMVERIRAAAPRADVLIVSPPRNLSTNAAYNLVDFAYASRTVAATQGCAHLDLQPYFGVAPPHQVSPTWYGDAGLNYMSAADMYHPNARGANVIAEAMFRLLKD